MMISPETLDASIPYIKKLVFSIGGYFYGQTTTTITFFDECMKVNKENRFELKPTEEQTVKYPESKESFMRHFKICT
ncbi:MAG: hypothetical protein PHV73_06880 [Eubacteriales bacterium]|nr:hypothetical protein [Eubacteriales bacterium]